MRAVCQEPGSALEPYARQLSMGCLLCLLLFACRALCVFNKPGGSSGGSELVQKWVDSIEPLETGSVGHDSGSLGHVILSPSSCLLACHYGCKFYGNLILGENFRQFSEISLNILRWGFIQSWCWLTDWRIFTARCYASVVLALGLCVSVCPSQVGVVLKWLNESSWILACELPSTRPTLC